MGARPSHCWCMEDVEDDPTSCQRQLSPNSPSTDSMPGSPCLSTSEVNDALMQNYQRVCSSDVPVTAVKGRCHFDRSLEQDFVCDGKILGEGASGCVRRMTHRDTGRCFAVKSLDKWRLNAAKCRLLQNEVEIFLQMDHPHVVRLEHVYDEERQLHLVLELLSGGELLDRFVEATQFTESAAVDVLRQILLAISYLHQTCKVVHRDLKLESLLYSSLDDDHLKLVDFGLAKRWDLCAAKCQDVVGTPGYMAPEICTDSYSEKCDLWSVGVIAFMLLTGEHPFPRQINDRGDVDYCNSSECDSPLWQQRSVCGLHPVAQNFLTSLLTVDVHRRSDVAEALAHPWLHRQDRSPEETGVSSASLCKLQDFVRASRFRRLCLSMMSWSLTVAELQDLQSQFATLDKDNKGTVPLVTFQEVLYGQLDVDWDTVVAIFALTDVNGHQGIAYRDFVAAALHARKALSEDALRITFQRFDATGSGVTVDNLQAVLGKTLGANELRELIPEADTDEDGQSSYEKVVTFLCCPGADVERTDVPGRITSDSLRSSRSSIVDALLAESCKTQSLRLTLSNEHVGQSVCGQSATPVSAHRRSDRVFPCSWVTSLTSHLNALQVLLIAAELGLLPDANGLV